MYSIKDLTDDELTTLRRIIKVRKMLNGFTYADLSEKTGYSEGYLRSALAKSTPNRKYKFAYAVLCDVLDITVGDQK